jgi:DNA (cytosine-5)-methyltransferase 1
MNHLQDKPLLYDLYCCAGGATRGYQMAGFRVIGIDRDPQPKYIGDGFIQMDCLEFMARYLAGEFEIASAFAASPPCQVHSALSHFATPGKHLDLIPQTREALRSTGLPYVMENVPGAPLDCARGVMLCGTMFRLGTSCGAELRRHRYFETNWKVGFNPECEHGWASRVIGGLAYDPAIYHAETGRLGKPRTIGVTGQGSPLSGGRTISVVGDHARDPGQERRKYRPRVMSVTGSTAQQNAVHNQIRETFTVKEAQEAMGINWCGMKGLSQAIPPAYSRFIGIRLMEELTR